MELTVNSYVFQSAKRLLEVELNKCYELLKQNEQAWNESTNLKLYDAYSADIDFDYNGAHVSFSADVQSEWFYRFCDNSYDLFIEDLRNDNIEWNELRNSIGSTSSFYFGTLHNSYSDKYVVALAEAVDDINVSILDFVQNEKGIIINTDFEDKDEQELEDYLNEMLSLTETIYADLKYKMDDIIKAYEYVKNFKEHQTDNFKEFVKENWIINL
jgi:hypothetical protein